MAYSTIDKSTDYQNNVLYTGNASTNAITGVGFQPDLVWCKNRGTTNWHNLYDAVRGVTKAIASNDDGAEGTRADGLTVFGSDGFTLGGDDANVNANTNDYASFSWKAGTTSGLSGGTITPSGYSFNTTSGFSILQYTGTGSAGSIPHGLGATPNSIIIKRTDAIEAWRNWNTGLTAVTYRLALNNNGAESDETTYGITAMDSTTFTLGSGSSFNVLDGTFIAYVWTNISGYSKFGSYLGNASTDGPFIYTGFKPTWFMWKKTATENWGVAFNPPNTTNVVTTSLRPDTDAVESTSDKMDFLSNGVKMRATSGEWNGSGGTYIYMAFGQPIISNSGICATAR